MALSLKVTPDKSGVYLKMGKVVSGAEFIHVNKIVFSKEDYVEKYQFYLIDLSDTESTSVNEEEKSTIIEQVDKVISVNNKTFVGVIAPNDFIYDLSTMWVNDIKSKLCNSNVFRSKKEAIDWLKGNVSSKWLNDEYWPFA